MLNDSRLGGTYVGHDGDPRAAVAPDRLGDRMLDVTIRFALTVSAQPTFENEDRVRAATRDVNPAA